MLNTLVKKIFGSRNERTLRRMRKVVEVIQSFESAVHDLSNEQLTAKTEEFKTRLQHHETLDDLLPEAFAVVREASLRTLGLRHFDVQLLGGMVLHEGNIAEMRTGEGKTLTETLPAYLNALSGAGVHIVTVNDYLAKRDSEWMAPIFQFLGLRVGVIYADMPHAEKQAAYAADIVYGTNNEFGFDYLRDNMVFRVEDKVQRALNFAIVDEVDSILIDEARTPLIISGAAEDSSELYRKINGIIPHLVAQASEETSDGDYTLDEKQKQAHLTELGHQHIEERLVEAGLLAPGESLYHASNIILMHHVNAALKAHVMYHCDIDYILQNNQVVIVDEHTGRTMPGRRWSDGLHQAIEAKEGVPIQNENQTLASITFQNLFRQYSKLAGMTGTADTEAYEFHEIYDLDVVVIPTNRVMCRKDEPDLVYLTQADKYQAVINDVRACVEREQPVLVGTASIEASEHLSRLLSQDGISHQVLNAKFHEKEAQIIAEAGRPKAVTIATNMAGRGTDIVLGGRVLDEEDQVSAHQAWKERHAAVIKAGGLRVIGSERHESRRIDNQLRGRSGRQGDPGSSRFYLSLDDGLMRIFASDRVAGIMRRLGMNSGEPIEHSLVSKAIENAQRKLEGYHFDVRKQLLSYDNVANEQRKLIYAQRATVIAMQEPLESISTMLSETLGDVVDAHFLTQHPGEMSDVDGLVQLVRDEFRLEAPIKAWIDDDPALTPEQIKISVIELATTAYQQKRQAVDVDVVVQFEKLIILQTIDTHWRDHLAAMDHLRQGIHLRGYAQKDPKQEYKREAFTLFSMLLDQLSYEIVKLLLTVEMVDVQPTSIDSEGLGDGLDDLGELVALPELDAGMKVGRNDACPCGSKKKYKVCHGRIS